MQGSAKLSNSQFSTVLLKAGPNVGAIIPSAALLPSRIVAPGQLISLYGSALASSTDQTKTLSPLPTKLADTTVSLGATDLGLLLASDGQVNAYLPPTQATGLVNLTIKNAKGQHTIGLLVASSAFAFFTLNGSGSGPAIAQHADGTLVTDANPARRGEIIVFYGTGLGATKPIAGLDYANIVPTVTFGSLPAELTFAGRTPGFVGLDQLNVRVPLDLPLSPQLSQVTLYATSAGRLSNPVTLPVQ